MYRRQVGKVEVADGGKGIYSKDKARETRNNSTMRVATEVLVRGGSVSGWE